MRLEIRIGSRSGRRWHDNLVRRLRALPATDVSVTLIPEARSKERDRLERLLWLERRLHGLDEGMLADPGLSSTPPAGDIEVILDLTADPVPGSWVVLYDGRSGEAAAADALRAGRFPLVSVVDGAGTVRAVGRPGSELPGLLATALADIGVGTATLIAGAVAGSPFASPADADAAGAASRTRGFAELAARRLVGAAIRRVYRMLYRAPHWRVGWRRLDGPDLLALGELPSRWHDLPDDGYRFFADPFPFEHDGRTYLFVEDFDHRVGKAVISVVEWGDDGPRGLPRPVLTHDVHTANAVKSLVGATPNLLASAVFLLVWARGELPLDWSDITCLMIGSLAGGVLGVRVARLLPVAALRVSIACCGVAAALIALR